MENMSPENSQMLTELSERTVYLMGGSFILGSLLTILLLVMLDFTRQLKLERMEKDNAEE